MLQGVSGVLVDPGIVANQFRSKVLHLRRSVHKLLGAHTGVAAFCARKDSLRGGEHLQVVLELRLSVGDVGVGEEQIGPGGNGTLVISDGLPILALFGDAGRQADIGPAAFEWRAF